MTVKELIELEWKQRCHNYTMNPDYVPKLKLNEKNANGLTKCIITFIRCTGHQADRINNMGVYRGAKVVDKVTDVFIEKGKWTPSTSRKGIADIKAIKKVNISGREVGIAVDIEVKYGKDRMSEHQKKIQQEVIATGGGYIIARTFEQFVEDWNNIN